MFEIDRSYIEPIEELESLQGHIWDLRTDYKDNPTLPKIQNYGIGEEDFEAYLERKQHFEDFKSSWRKHRLLILAVVFIIPVALYSLLVKGPNTGIYAYSTGALLSTLVYVVYLAIEAMRARQFRNNPCETFIKALLSWEKAQRQQSGIPT